ncbi:hypothetical protein Nepgr_005662 [Nepenthes gracilis]|uniref:Uncharacterized protein n=1 Tax=Nepenthes gracilis TaxID=150966 RepID=A0AAD3XGN7_NEPGR|nr:hypothetical protein Nepgr_005662 [Nepenthes gracilis]
MGFLNKIWDETLAGPTPDSGLGKLRKFDSFSYIRSSSTDIRSIAPTSKHHGRRHGDDHGFPVSRSITLLRSKSLSIDCRSSTPSSPANSSGPSSPFSPGTPREDFKRLNRKKTMVEALEDGDPRSPTVYDWVMICALDT